MLKEWSKIVINKAKNRIDTETGRRKRETKEIIKKLGGRSQSVEIITKGSKNAITSREWVETNSYWIIRKVKDSGSWRQRKN